MGRISADDAVRSNAELSRWLTQPDGFRFMADVVWSARMLQGFVKHDLTSTVRDSNRELSQTLAHEAPYWCDSSMGDLLAASAATVPAQQFEKPVRLARSGSVYFTQPLPVDWVAARDGDGVRDLFAEIQLITWQPAGASTLIVPWRVSSPRLVALSDGRPCRVVSAETMGALEILNPNGAHTRGALPQLGRLLHALAGLLRTPVTTEDDSGPSNRAVREARKRGVPDPAIRRIYLRRPESGGEELAALRSEMAGAPRGHWVRGHWKNQWFSSVEEHRSIWVEGYPRGDFTKGEVSGQKVLIAKSSDAELRGHP